MEGWIDVKDALPNTDRQVYCVCEVENQNTGEFQYIYGVGNYLANLNVWVGSLSCQYTIFWRDPDPLPSQEDIDRHHQLH